jgi:CRP-like cAMP-binding protein
MSPQELLNTLKKCDLFRDFSDEELSALLPYIRTTSHEKGDWIFTEGEEGQNIYIIQSGQVEVLKKETFSGEFQPVEVLTEGDWFGEMAHFEEKRRSASIRALTDVQTLVLFIEDPILQKSFYSKISHLIAEEMSHRILKTDTTLVATLNEKLELTKARIQVSKTLIYTFVLIAIYFNMNQAIETYAAAHMLDIEAIFFPLSILTFGVFSYLIMLSASYPLSFYGLTLRNWKKNVLYSTLITIPLLLLIVTAKWVVIQFYPPFQNEPLFDWSSAPTLNSLILFSSIYIALVPVQELIVRGLFQSCFRNFFHGPHPLLSAIIASNLIFEVIHTTVNIWIALFTMLFGLFWGYMYEKQKSLVGPIISHILIGWLSFFGLNIVRITSLM